MAHADLIDALLKDVFPSRSTQEWFALLTANKHPAVIVPTMAQLLEQAVHRERKAFVPVQLGAAQFEGRCCRSAWMRPGRCWAAGRRCWGRTVPTTARRACSVPCRSGQRRRQASCRWPGCAWWT
jgi:crotonobetainyl-CoA:carnitine CoA-transferase CaiB-like acyl-CoA transferase